MSLLPFDIKTINYDEKIEFAEGVEVNIEEKIDNILIKSEGKILEVWENECLVEFITKLGNKKISIFPINFLYPKINPIRVEHTYEYPKFNLIIIKLTNGHFNLVDLANPGEIKYDFVLDKFYSYRIIMISPNILLYIASDKTSYGCGYILDLENKSKTFCLRPSPKIVKERVYFSGNFETSYIVVDNFLYLLQQGVVTIFNLRDGYELKHWYLADDFLELNLFTIKTSWGDKRVLVFGRRTIWQLPSPFNSSGIVRSVSLPIPERNIYTDDNFTIFARKFEDKIINPLGKILINMDYMDDVDRDIFNDEEISNFIDIVLNEKNIYGVQEIISLSIENKFAALRKKYPSIRIIFSYQVIRDLISKLNCEKIINGIMVKNNTKSKTRYPTLLHKLYSKNNEFLGCLGLCLDTGRIVKHYQNEAVCPYDLIGKPLKLKFYRKVTRELLIYHVLGEELRSIIYKITNEIKYEDITGQPLRFNNYYIFDGDKFTKKDLTHITTNNGEKVKVDTVHMLSDLRASLNQKHIPITIEGKEIPIWEHDYPRAIEKTNYYVEEKIMSYNDVLKLDNIKGPGVAIRELRSNNNIIMSALSKCRLDYCNQNQKVYFFVWEEDNIKIRIPLSYCQEFYSRQCYGGWSNNCYIIYHNEYVRIVKVK